MIKRRLPLFLIMLIVCMATTTMSASLISTYFSFHNACEKFVKDYGYPDAFVEFNQEVNKNDIEEIYTIDGINQIDLRWNMILDVRTSDKYTLCNIKNYDETQFTKFYYHQEKKRHSTMPNVVISKDLANYHHINVGDAVIAKVKYEGEEKSVRLLVNAIISTPETMRTQINRNTLIDKRDFGYAYMHTEEMNKFLPEMKDKGNQIVIKTNANVNRKEVLKKVENVLNNKGIDIYDSYTQEETQIYNFIHNSIYKYLSIVSYSVPLAFSLISLILIMLFMYQIIRGMTREVGIMNALGIKKSSITGLMISFALTIGLSGALIGIGCAYPIANFIYSMIATTYNMPIGAGSLNVLVCIISVLAITLISMLASLITIHSIRKLSPREAMINNLDKKKNLPKRLEKAFAKAHPSVAIGVNTIHKNIPRFLISVFAVMVSFNLIFIALSINNSTSFNSNQIAYRTNFDARVYEFEEGDSDAFFNQIRNIEYVSKMEKSLIANEEISFEGRKAYTSLTALEPNHELLKIVDLNNRDCPIKDNSIVLDSTIADDLKVKVGDIVTINDYSLEVNAISKLGVAKTQVVSINTMRAINITYFNSAIVNFTDETKFLTQVRKINNALPILGENIVTQYQIDMAPMHYTMIAVMAFALIIGITTITTMSLLAYREDKRKYCILRTLGYQVINISNIAIFQMLVSFILGITIIIAPAIAVTKVIIDTLCASYATFYFFNYLWIYLTSIGIVLFFILLAHLSAMIAIKRTTPSLYLNNRE